MNTIKSLFGWGSSEPDNNNEFVCEGHQPPIQVDGKLFFQDGDDSDTKVLIQNATIVIDHKTSENPFLHHIVLVNNDELELNTGDESESMMSFEIEPDLEYYRIDTNDCFMWKSFPLNEENPNKKIHNYVFLMNEKDMEKSLILHRTICHSIAQSTIENFPSTDMIESLIQKHTMAECNLPFSLKDLSTNKKSESTSYDDIEKQEISTPIKKSSEREVFSPKTPQMQKLMKADFRSPITPKIYPSMIEDVSKDDSDNVLESAKGELYIYDVEKLMFVLIDSEAIANIVLKGDYKDYTYSLTVVKTNKKVLSSQIVKSTMNVQCFEDIHSITWFQDKPKDDATLTLSFVFKDIKEEEKFKNTIISCIYQSNLKKNFSELPVEDQTALVCSTNVKRDDLSETSSLTSEMSEEDWVDFERDENTKSDDDENGYESDDEDFTPNIIPSGKQTRIFNSPYKNKNVAPSSRHNRMFVSQSGGKNINVYKNQDNRVEYQTSITDLVLPNGELFFSPDKIMLHNAEDNLLCVHPDQEGDKFKGKVYNIDLNKEAVVEEWKTDSNELIKLYDLAPVRKDAQMTSEKVIAGINNNMVFALDPRLNTSHKIVGDLQKIQNKSNMKLSCIATTRAGNVVTGSAEGDLRLYSGIPGLQKGTGAKGAFPKRAKSLLYGLGDSIIGVDVTSDGRWILATCHSYLTLSDTSLPDTEKNGFTNTKGMGSNKPIPKRLFLSPEDTEKVGIVRFTPARFNTGVDQETWIVTSTGPYIVTWNFKKVKQGKINDYIIKKVGSSVDKIVRGEFIHKDSNAAPIVVLSENDLKIENRFNTKYNPYRSSFMKYQGRD